MSLIEIVERLCTEDKKQVADHLNVDYLYIEKICLASSEQIIEALEFMYERYYFGFPFWARLLAFRILLTLKPDDDSIRKWAIEDIESNDSPGWEDHIRKWYPAP